MLKESLLRKKGGNWEYKEQILTCFIQPAASENIKESHRLQLRENGLKLLYKTPQITSS